MPAPIDMYDLKEKRWRKVSTWHVENDSRGKKRAVGTVDGGRKLYKYLKAEGGV